MTAKGARLKSDAAAIGLPERIEPAWPTWKRTALLAIVFGIYLAAALLLFGPVAPLSTDYLPRGGTGDPAQMVWFLAYTPHAIARGLNPFQSNLIDFPTGVNLANNTSVPLLGVLTWPISATLGPVASFNLLLRLGPFLSASTLFVVLGRWCRYRVARFLGGLCFGFCPYIIGQMIGNAHINLLFVPLFPVLVGLVDELLARQSWPWSRLALTLGLCCSAEMYIAPELLSDFGIVIGCMAVVVIIFYPSSVRSRFLYACRSLAGAFMTFSVVCGYLVYEMVAGRGHLTGAVYPIAHLQAFKSTPYETLFPTAQQLFMTTRISAPQNFPTRDVNELGGYLSIPLVVFILVAVVLWHRRSGFVPIALATLFAFVLSLGESAHLQGHTVALPEVLLTHLPLLKSTLPDRFSFEVLLGASCLFAMGIDRALRALVVRGPLGRGVLGGLLGVGVAAVIVALFPKVPVREEPLVFPPSMPKEIAAHVPTGGVVLAYPYPVPPVDEAMAWQAASGFTYRLLGGYATVASADGTGQEWPVLQRPKAVQSYLAELELGRRSEFPSAAGRPSSAALCSYATRFHVSDFVIFHYGRNVTAATAYLASIPHTTTVDNRHLTIFHLTKDTTSSHC